MWVAYLDDAGDPEKLPAATGDLVTPVFVIGGVAVDQSCLHDVTMEFLALKRRFFPHLCPPTPHLLDWVRPEVKGTELKRMTRSPRRKERRTGVTFLDQVLRLLEGHNAKVFGRVWVKAVGAEVDKAAVTTSSVQACCTTFQHLLESVDERGLVIIDSSSAKLNSAVSHSVFTQKFKATGDAYDRLIEMPTFGHSENHVGLQIADILVSGLLFPIASYSFCTGHITSVHVHPRFEDLKARFARRVMRLQHRYYGDDGRYRGGVVTSDKIAERPGSVFFN